MPQRKLSFKVNLGSHFSSDSSSKKNLEQLFSCPSCAQAMIAKSTLLPCKDGMRFRMHCETCDTKWEYVVVITEV